MLDDALHRVLLHILDNGHLVLAIEGDVEQGVGVTQSQSGLAHRQSEVCRLSAAGVDGRRDLAGNAQTTGNALAELVTCFAVQGDGVSHV